MITNVTLTILQTADMNDKECNMHSISGSLQMINKQCFTISIYAFLIDSN